MNSRRRLLTRLALFALLTALLGSYTAGSLLSAPNLHPIGPAPADLAALEVEFSGLRGWFVPAAADRPAGDRPCVLLMHGVRSDRRVMTDRARWLREAGFSSLLFDFQAHGESPGERITFGALEAENARTALGVLRGRFGCGPVGAVGQSLGGAAALLGERPLALQALVLEAVFPTIEQAAANRLRGVLGAPGELLTPLLTWQLKLRIGVEPERLRPLERIRSFTAPVLIASGTADHHTLPEEAEALFAAANEPKEFWAVPGAGHVDLYAFAPTAYRERVLGFLRKYLTPGG